MKLFLLKPSFTTLLLTVSENALVCQQWLHSYVTVSLQIFLWQHLMHQCNHYLSICFIRSLHSPCETTYLHFLACHLNAGNNSTQTGFANKTAPSFLHSLSLSHLVGDLCERVNVFSIVHMLVCECG